MALVRQLGCDFCQQSNTVPQDAIVVSEVSGALSVYRSGSREKPVSVDFVGGKAGHRRKFGGGKGQDIARAIGLNKGVQPSVLDATGGLGRDAFVLATLGCPVTLLERSPIVAALLKDGIRRGQASEEVRDIAQKNVAD